MKHLRLAYTLFLSTSLLQVNLSAQQASEPELLRLGNGIAAIAEGQIITVE